MHKFLPLFTFPLLVKYFFWNDHIFVYSFGTLISSQSIHTLCLSRLGTYTLPLLIFAYNVKYAYFIVILSQNANNLSFIAETVKISD